MVVKDDGTKWACQSCLKGHRVSGCTHIDRELTLVPKKGRPVTQCQHCRLERKKRSAHVKCDCGETEKPHHPKEKCIHLREAEERAKAGFRDEPSRELESTYLAAVAEEQGCCCGHGGRCTCSLVKKESQLKDSALAHGPAVHKPKLETTRSDGEITVFANGHHKPVHKRNHAAHESGMPYKMPMPRSNTDNNISAQARRSVDSLALDSSMSWNPATATQPPVPFATERRMSKSEQPSPRHSAIETRGGGLADAKLSSIDFSALGPIQTNQSMDSSASDQPMFSSMDPMSGMADSSYDPWTGYPSADLNMPNNNPFGVWATNFDSTNAAQPALTAASSGTQSEIDEIPTMDDFYGFPMPSIQEDAGAFNLDGDGSNINRRSLPPNFFGNADFSMANPNPEWPTSLEKSKALSNDQAIGMANVWNTPTMPTMSSIAQRPTSMTATCGRSQSQLVSGGNAQNEDLIKQLFPDIDINNGVFVTGNSPTAMESSALRRMGGVSGMPVSSSVDLGPVDESAGFTSQPWTDGSVSVPTDPFTSPYNIDQDFPSPDYWGNTTFQ
ncbi:Copper resistance [Lecanosticta acicola]|uniref:Copper resistance n=1 Tax=Lecanosticta acicola TaxID=111012 RepID=A0AAI8Z2G2_9PEZI|nr:Copper resistance [Lecanosticta acicola]